MDKVKRKVSVAIAEAYALYRLTLIVNPTAALQTDAYLDLRSVVIEEINDRIPARMRDSGYADGAVDEYLHGCADRREPPDLHGILALIDQAVDEGRRAA